jgi:SAM-dependent methyltransferase
MCRLFQVTDFHIIDECLYLQRMHKMNTQREQEINARIQVETVALYDQHVERNAVAWSKRRGLHSLYLGPSGSKPQGYLAVNSVQGAGVDIVADVSKGIDLPDSSVGTIRVVDYLERVPDQIGLFNEFYRLLTHGGLLLILTASTDGRGAFQDPTHVSFYNENSFWYYTDRQYAQFAPGLTCRFQISRLETYFPTEWHQEKLISYVCANLIAVKDGPRQGGQLRI